MLLFTRLMSTAKRPLSPHLTIYSFQLTSAMSIANRMTGAFLAAGTLSLTIAIYGFGTMYAISPENTSKTISAIQNSLNDTVYSVAKFALAFPYCYHTFNGIRHWIWDAGYALSMKGVYNTGYAVLAGTTAVSAYLSFTNPNNSQKEAEEKKE